MFVKIFDSSNPGAKPILVTTFDSVPRVQDTFVQEIDWSQLEVPMPKHRLVRIAGRVERVEFVHETTKRSNGNPQHDHEHTYANVYLERITYYHDEDHEL